MFKISSVNQPYQPISKVQLYEDKEDIIEPLLVDQVFLDNLNSCTNEDEQTKLFTDILKNEVQFQEDVFQIKEVNGIFIPDVLPKLRFGKTYSFYPPLIIPAKRFEKV